MADAVVVGWGSYLIPQLPNLKKNTFLMTESDSSQVVLQGD